MVALGVTFCIYAHVSDPKWVLKHKAEGLRRYFVESGSFKKGVAGLAVVAGKWEQYGSKMGARMPARMPAFGSPRRIFERATESAVGRRAREAGARFFGGQSARWNRVGAEEADRGETKEASWVMPTTSAAVARVLADQHQPEQAAKKGDRVQNFV
jgi:hypothetical protein